MRDGIRGSKDPRAEIGKFPDSTNERKKMSTKTIKQRIALVAASALTAGFLSVVSAPVASAAAGVAIDRDDISATTTFTAGENRGVCYVADATLDNADSTNTVEMLSTGILKLSIAGSPTISATSPAGGSNLKFAISGPANWINYTAATGNIAVPTLSADGKTLTATGTSTDVVATTAATLVPTGAGTVQVTITNNRSVTAGVTTAIEIITISVKASCTSGTISTGDSYVKLTSTTSKGTATGTNVDDADYTYAANAGTIYVRADLFDANGVALANTSATGLLTAETSSGAIVAHSTDTATVGLASTSTKGTYFAVSQATEDVPWAGTITIKHNGVVLATKSAKIFGAPKTIEVSGLDIRQAGAGSGQGGDFVMKDSAGNIVETNITGFTTLTDAQSSVITAGTASRTPSNTQARLLAGTPKGQFDYACLSSKGPGATATGLTLKYTNSALVTITSAPFTITCGGAAYTYSASLDKASYVPGDIATLTITAKDAYGNPAYDGDTLGVAGSVPSISGSNMTIVNASTSADTFLAGKKEYKFTVGATEGTYNMVVDLPEFNSASKPQSAITVGYKIAATTATVSNADVLKSIVALIASINKQIQALQKLILKRN